jgi:hypothetical protein
VTIDALRALLAANPAVRPHGPADATAQGLAIDAALATIEAGAAAKRASTGAPGDRPEREIQAEVEAWLVRRGYVRLTAEAARAAHKVGAVGLRGWFAHWPRCEGNPLMADLLIVAHPPSAAPPLLLELKRGERATWRPGQKELVALGVWRVAFSGEEARGIVEAWEGGKGVL